MSYWRLYYHFVWTTRDRQPQIAPDIEAAIYQCLHQEAKAMYAPFFYVGGMADHVHVVTAVRPALALADFVKQVKGSSSHFVTHELKRPFVWQKGYGVFSVSATTLDTVKAYVLNQKQHHHAQTLVVEWEESHDWNLGPEEG